MKEGPELFTGDQNFIETRVECNIFNDFVLSYYKIWQN